MTATGDHRDVAPYGRCRPPRDIPHPLVRETEELAVERSPRAAGLTTGGEGFDPAPITD